MIQTKVKEQKTKVAYAFQMVILCENEIFKDKSHCRAAIYYSKIMEEF